MKSKNKLFLIFLADVGRNSAAACAVRSVMLAALSNAAADE